LSACVERDPANLDCLSLLGSAYATRGAAMRSPGDNDQARRWYSRFLEIAPPSDRRVARIRAILGAGREPPSAEIVVEPLRLVLTRPRVVQTGEILRLSVADASVVTVVTQSPTMLRFEGKRLGATQVTASNADGSVTRWDVTVDKE
jgi:hypothetical protein